MADPVCAHSMKAEATTRCYMGRDRLPDTYKYNQIHTCLIMFALRMMESLQDLLLLQTMLQRRLADSIEKASLGSAGLDVPCF